LLNLFFDPEDGSDMFLRNICELSMDYTVLYLRRRNFILYALVNIVVEALYYKPEGRGYKTRLGECNCSIYLILPALLGPGVYSASDRNKYQKQKNDVSGD
jgi:hypothetical protein